MKKEKIKFEIAWAMMPLPKEKLELINQFHRKRPYLLCMDMDSFYYAFPCTSNVFNNNIRYENQKIDLRTDLSYNKSLANIGEVFKLPKENILGSIKPIHSCYYNRIIKKLNACSEYSNYPQEFVDYISKFDYSLETNDLIELDEQLFIITEIKQKDYIVSKVYSYPINNYYPEDVDGLKYFVIPESYKFAKNESFKYRSRIPGYAIKDKYPINIENKDYSKLYNLEPGMIISYNENGNINKMVVLENCITDLFVICGEEKQMYRDYKPMTIPVDTKIEYKVTGYLSDDRTKILIENTNENIITKKLIKNTK